MDVAGKTAAGKSAGRRFVPSIVQPLELSQRWDSSRERLGKVRLGPAQEPATREVGRKAELVLIDRRRVDEAAAWISAKVAATLRRGAEDVGEYVLDTFFAGDPVLAGSRNPNKSASFRALAEKCGTAELPISKTWLNNAVGIALMNRRLPETARAFRALPSSFQQALLPLREPESVERVAMKVANRELSCRDLRELVAEHLARATKANGRRRPRTPAILKKLGRSTTIFGADESEPWFTETEIDELDAEQKKLALRTASCLMERLRELKIRLKEA